MAAAGAAEGLLRAAITARGPAVVTAAHPAVATAAAGALAAGGNAFDAVLAGCLMETVALPMKCGLAGDLVALFRPAGGELTALVSVGAGAAALDRGVVLTHTGPGSVGVPGAPHGYATLAAMGRLPLAQLAAPAQRAAAAGIPWREVDLAYLRAGLPLLHEFSPEAPYLNGGALPRVGDLRILPGLGALIAAFVERREELFMGPLGAAIATRVQALGGYLTAEDFHQRPARLLPAARHDTPFGPLHTTPAPTHGPALARALGRLTGAAPSPALLREILAEEKARGRRAADGGTSVLTCADAEGNVVVVLHSNSFPQMASGVVMPDGLILNNRPGRGFDGAAPPGAPAAPGAGKTPPTTLHAWALEGAGGALTLGATPGGVNQLPWNLQVLARVAAGDGLADAVCHPRWAMDAKGRVTHEPGAEALAGEGDSVAGYALRSVAQILTLADRPGGLHRAAADPRTGAVALSVY